MEVGAGRVHMGMQGSQRTVLYSEGWAVNVGKGTDGSPTEQICPSCPVPLIHSDPAIGGEEPERKPAPLSFCSVPTSPHCLLKSTPIHCASGETEAQRSESPEAGSPSMQNSVQVSSFNVTHRWSLCHEPSGLHPCCSPSLGRFSALMNSPESTSCVLFSRQISCEAPCCPRLLVHACTAMRLLSCLLSPQDSFSPAPLTQLTVCAPKGLWNKAQGLTQMPPPPGCLSEQSLPLH